MPERRGDAAGRRADACRYESEGPQAFVVGHDDTANRHLHIAINRVHPDTGVAWSTSHDYIRLEQSMALQSEAYGYKPVPGRHTDAVQGAERAPARTDGVY